MKNELKEIKKNLKATLTGFKDAKEEYGYDLANETYYVKQALKQVNLLLLHNVVGRSEQLKAFADYVQRRMWEGEDKDLSEFVEDFLSL